MTTSSLTTPGPTSSGKTIKTAAYYAAFTALGMASASLGPTLPGLAENTQTQLSQISFLFTARSLGYLIGSYFGGRLYDKFAGHSVMATVLLVMAGMLGLMPITPMLWLLTLVLLALGIGEGSLDVGGNTLLVWVHRDKVGPFMNALHFFFGVGAFLSPIIVAQVILMTGDITWAYWVLALLTLPVGLWLWQLSSPIAPATSVQDAATAKANTILVGFIAFFFFLYVGAEVSFGGWIFTYALAIDLTNEATAAFLTSAFWGALTVGRLISIPIAGLLRPRIILLADLLGCIISVGIVLIWSNSLIAVWIGALGLGLSMASIFPITLSLAERRMTITGKITGWFFVGASTGGMTLPWLIGQFFESFGPRTLMLFIMLNLLLAVGVYAVIIRISSKMAIIPTED